MKIRAIAIKTFWIVSEVHRILVWPVTVRHTRASHCDGKNCFTDNQEI